MTNNNKLALLENEYIDYEGIKGDCWYGGIGPFAQTQNSGKYTFTNQRIVFFGSFLDKYFSIAYQDIDSIKTANVGLFIPTGILVILKDGTKYKLSLLQRKKWLLYLEDYVK